MRIASYLLVAASAALAACSGTPVPDPPSIAGNWTLTYSNLTDGTTVCHGALRFTITQTGEEFTGTQVGAGSVVCSGAAPAFAIAGSDSTVIGGESLHAGRIDNGDVAFALATLQSHDAGSLDSGTSMSGTSTWNLPVLPAGSVTLHGSWNATKE